LQKVVTLRCKGPKRSCKSKNLSCAEYAKRRSANTACIIARMAVMFKCYGGGDMAHIKELQKAKKARSMCIKRLQECKDKENNEKSCE